MLGGQSASNPVSDEVKQLANKHKADIEASLHTKFPQFEPTTYTSQLVNGTNFNITINVGNGKTITAKIYKPIHGESSFTSAH